MRVQAREDKVVSCAKVQIGSKNELRRKNICFCCNEPWEPNQSCSRKMVVMTKVEQEGIPSNNSEENEMGSSTIVESIDFYGNTLEMYEKSCGDVDTNSPMHGDQQIVRICEEGQGEDTQENLRDELLMIMQHQEHLEVHEHEEEYGIYSVHCKSSLES